MQYKDVPIHALLFLFLLLGATSQAHAQQGTLQGTVQGGDTGESLPGANITFLENNLGTSTDSDGNYQIENVPVGTYTIEISFIGYESKRQEITIQAAETTTLDVTLELSAQKYDEVVVTGSREEERLGESPVHMEVVSREDIETFGGETLFSALSVRKGVNYSRMGINQQSISMRGFDSHYNSRLVHMRDGHVVQIPGTGLPQSNYTSTSELDVRQIEVIVGPASALYGSNANTGVVNVLTKTPWDESGITLDVRGGQKDLLDVNGRAAGVIGDNFGWKISGQYLSATDYKPPTGGPNASVRDSTHFFGTSFNETELVNNYGVSSIRADGSLYYRFDNSWQIRGDYGLSINDNFNATTFGRVRIRDLQVQSQNLEISSDHWLFRGTHTANNGGNSYTIGALAFFAQSSYLAALQEGVPPNQARQQTLQNVPALRDTARYALEGDLWDAEAQYKNTFGIGDGSLQLITGLQIREYDPSSGKTFLADAAGRDISETEQGGYVQLDYRPSETLRFNTALRYDQHSRYEGRLSPKAAVVYSFSDAHSVRASYNRAYKNPEIFQLHFFAGPFRGNIDGFTIRRGPTPNADVVREIDPLSPEEVTSLEAEYRGRLTDDLSVNLVAYNSWYNNFISPLTTVASADPSLQNTYSVPTYAFEDGELVNPLGLFTYYNYGEATIRGLDAGFEYSVGRTFTFSGGLSLIGLADAEQKEQTPPLTLNVPRAMIKGSLLMRDVGFENYHLRLTGRWRSAYTFRVGHWDSSVFYEDGKVPARFTAGLTAGYTIPGTGIELQGRATNLFNTQIPDKLGAPTTGRLVTISASYTLDRWNP